jgi:hypothetical protein
MTQEVPLLVPTESLSVKVLTQLLAAQPVLLQLVSSPHRAHLSKSFANAILKQ